MRTRKSNKKKSFKYQEAFDLGSDESASEIEEVADGDDDVEFQEPEGDDEEQGASDAGDDVQFPPGKLREQADLLREAQGARTRLINHESKDMDSDDEAGSTTLEGTHAARRKLPNRSAIHEVLPYPKDVRQTRVYEGPLKKHIRGEHLLKLLYGPQPEHLNIIRQLLQKWFRSHTLPQKSAGDGVMHSPWLAENYESRQNYGSRAWYDKYRAAKSHLQSLRRIRPDHAEMFRPSGDQLICLTGPSTSQNQFRMHYGVGVPISEAGEPQAEAQPASESPTFPKAWMLDTGAIPTAISWAPMTGHTEQFLAICTVPHSDQSYKDADAPVEDPDAKKNGSLQIWAIPCHKGNDGHARLLQLYSFDWGRPQTIQWCPTISPDETQIGMLAILCRDGQARVIEVPKPTPEQENLTWITSPVATLAIPDECDVRVTCLTWINTNRICLGHNDGSVSLWSIYPQHMIMRRAVHQSQILEVSSAFPSHPYHIASVPVSGCPTLTDLCLPSAETTYIPLPNCVNFQPNLLDWNDILQGYLTIQPSAEPHNTVIGFAHLRYFIHTRTIVTNPSPPTCVASGRTHPFTLVGCADGSLWAFNPLRALARDRGDDMYKIKIFQHEFRPAAKFASPSAVANAGSENIRGAARILQGFQPEISLNPRPEIVDLIEKERLAKLKKGYAKGGGQGQAAGRPKKKPLNKAQAKDAANKDESEDGLKPLEELALLNALEKTRVIVHEPKTRITVAAWNPNVEFGWWAAAAMGSGLVKVMDLGLGE